MEIQIVLKGDDLLEWLSVLILGNLCYQKLELMGECNELSMNLYPKFASTVVFMGLALIRVQRIGLRH